MKRFFPFVLVATLAQAAPTASAPATLSKEADLTTIKLTAEASERLRLKTVPVARRAVPEVRMFAGEVVRPLAAAGAVAAPVLGGTLDETLRLADAQTVADGRVRAAQAQLDAAALASSRAQRVFAAEAGSARSLEEAKTALVLAEVALATAQSQRALLGAAAAAGGGDSLLWIRAAIYSGEAPLLAAQASAVVQPLGRGPAAAGLSVAPVAGPATANAPASTVDWYYALPAGARLRPGERIAVEIPLLDSTVEHLVVPFGAVVHDIHGGTWVYEAVAPLSFVRRRVQVMRLAGTDAVLSSGPTVGTRIVTDGSAELFGTEFMTGK